jgi:hypothetical protein
VAAHFTFEMSTNLEGKKNIFESCIVKRLKSQNFDFFLMHFVLLFFFLGS